MNEAIGFPKVAVVGAGAVGCYFGGMLARAGVPVTLIGRTGHVDAIKRDGLHLRSIQFAERVQIAATTDVAVVSGADLVLLTVKTRDTESAAQTVAPHLAREATLISLQNGVDNAERIQKATGIAALGAVVYVAAEMTAPGEVTHTGRGDLIIGPRGDSVDNQASGPFARIAALFGSAGVPCVISGNVGIDLWRKLVMNCAYNAISALARARYGAIAAHDDARRVVEALVRETVGVAQACGVPLPLEDTIAAAWQLGRAIAGAYSSTAQDIERGRLTEIDSLNGYVARRGAELGVPTPMNQTVHALVRLLEQSTQLSA